MGSTVWVIGVSLVLAVALSGCAGTWQAIQETPDRTAEFAKDPARVRNMGSRILEGLVGAGAAIACSLSIGAGGFLCGPVAEYLVYEYILEPLGLTGPYWERGPNVPVIDPTGTLVVPGEVFREFTESECAFYQATWHRDPDRPRGGWCESRRKE